MIKIMSKLNSKEKSKLDKDRVIRELKDEIQNLKKSNTKMWNAIIFAFFAMGFIMLIIYFMLSSEIYTRCI